MPTLAIHILLLVLFGLLALFVRSFTLQRALTTELSAAHFLESATVGHATHHTAACLRIPHYSRKRWRRTPGMQSGLAPPTTLAGRAGHSACSNAWRAAGCAVCMGNASSCLFAVVWSDGVVCPSPALETTCKILFEGSQIARNSKDSKFSNIDYNRLDFRNIFREIMDPFSP